MSCPEKNAVNWCGSISISNQCLKCAKLSTEWHGQGSGD